MYISNNKTFLLILVFFVVFSLSLFAIDFGAGVSIGSYVMNPWKESNSAFFSSLPIEGLGSFSFTDNFELDFTVGVNVYTTRYSSCTPVGLVTSALALYTHEFDSLTLRAGGGLQFSAVLSDSSYEEYTTYGFLSLIADLGVEYKVTNKLSVILDGFVGYSVISYDSDDVSWFGAGNFGAVPAGFKVTVKHSL